jgi:hypothetical protein
MYGNLVKAVVDFDAMVEGLVAKNFTGPKRFSVPGTSFFKRYTWMKILLLWNPISCSLPLQ